MCKQCHNREFLCISEVVLPSLTFFCRTHFRSSVKIDYVHNLCKSNLWSGVLFLVKGGVAGHDSLWNDKGEKTAKI